MTSGSPGAVEGQLDHWISQRSETVRAVLTCVMSVVVSVVGVLAYLTLIGTGRRGGILSSVALGGTASRLTDGLSRLGPVSLGDVRTAVLWSAACSVIVGGLGTALLRNWWRWAWKAGPGAATSGKMLGWVFGVGSAAVAVVEAVVILVAMTTSDGQPAYATPLFGAAGKVIVTLAWVKWLLTGSLVLLVVAMDVSSLTAAIRSPLPRPDPGLDGEPPPKPVAPEHLGICCSGGGLRAAGFALGALAKLEEEHPRNDAGKPTDPPVVDLTGVPGHLGLLGRARYLASVSGGGYAATAWRILAGTGELPAQPRIGSPLTPRTLRPYVSRQEPAADLLQHVQERRRYLANGQGGLLRAGVETVAKMVFHFGLLLAAVAALAWPLGRLIVGFPITGVGRNSSIMADGLGTYPVDAHQWFPPLALLVLAVLGLFLRLRLDRVKLRTTVDLGIKALAGAAAVLAVLLIGLPWVLDRFLRYLPGGAPRVALAGVYATILGLVWQVSQKRLMKNARYLGGVALALGLLLFALLVMGQAADTDALLSPVAAWLLIIAFVAVAFVLFNPDRWSLHGLYRRCLAGTFSTRWVVLESATPAAPGAGAGPARPEPRVTEGVLSNDEECPLSSYRTAQGPEPVVCCAAARKDGANTGIKVLSMTFDPYRITVHGWTGSADQTRGKDQEMKHSDFQCRLPRGSFGVALNTLMGAASISGAAVAPSLGRMDLRSTNALLAAFNARLGVWVPNPAGKRYGRSTTPRLVNMFKEILRVYDPIDPNVYATDGGHWENLGLVELIRRRCAVIICIDASGDPPGTYATLKQAVKLAELECDARIHFTAGFWRQLALGEDGSARRGYGTGEVEYDDGTKAELLYVRSVVMRESPLPVLRYASNDPKFPNYATSDQLLSADELNNLIRLGYDSMGQALGNNPAFVQAVVAELKQRPWRPGPPAATAPVQHAVAAS